MGLLVIGGLEVLESVYTPHIGRDVYLRPGTADRQVWADTFTGGYHLPPDGFPAPATVLDLGANIGLTAAHYQHLWPDARVVAVEMDDANAAMIRHNAPAARVIVQAVAAYSGYRYYDRLAESDAYALGSGNVSTEALTLHEIIASGFGGPVDFVKMDVEATEWELFEPRAVSAWKPLVKALLVEVHGKPVGLNADEAVVVAVMRLEAAGFKACRYGRHPQAVWAVR